MESESTRTTPPHSTTERVKRFFDQRDWKFYCALAAGVGLVGATGAYYYYSTISSGRRRPRSPASSNGSNRKFKAPAGMYYIATLYVFSLNVFEIADKTTTPLPAGYEDMSSSAIANLSEQVTQSAWNADHEC